MAYTVTASGTFNQTNGYFTINGTSYYAAGTWTFDSKPAITIKTSANGGPTFAGNCKITVNGETVSTGANTYTLETDDDTIDIVFTEGTYSSRSYYSAAVTTSQSDPMAPKDSHNTNVGSVAYELESAVALVGGVAYELESGTVLTGGVAMEIPIMGKCTVTITGTGQPASSGSCYVVIDGVQYTGAATVEVEEGTVMTVYTSRIYHNDALLSSGHTTSGYDYTITGDTEVVLTYSTKLNNYIDIYG